MNTYKSTTENETLALGHELGQRLLVFPHNVLVYGDLGVGKTRFIQGVARGMSVFGKVKSPTYTLMQMYKGKKVLCHYDLYRLDEVGSIDHYGLQEDFDDVHRVVIVEWADRLKKEQRPEDRIEVRICGDKKNQNARTITVQFSGEELPTMQEVSVFWHKYCCPLNIRKHCRKVAQLAENIATELMKKNKIVSPMLCRKAGLLHDVLRFVGLKNFIYYEFMRQKITPLMKKTWKKLQKEYGDVYHEVAAETLFNNLGYPEMARVIKKHRFDVILEEDGLVSWDEKVLFYADKRVLHDEYVTLKERFDDSIKRHHGGVCPGNVKEMIKRTYALEKELLRKTGIAYA